MVCDLEAGVGAVVRAGHADVVLVVTEPTAKSIEVARRAAETASQAVEVMVVANRVRDDADLERIRKALPGLDLSVVPEEPAIAAADREGAAPLDQAPDAAGVQALVVLAKRISARQVP